MIYFDIIILKLNAPASLEFWSLQLTGYCIFKMFFFLKEINKVFIFQVKVYYFFKNWETIHSICINVN